MVKLETNFGTITLELQIDTEMASVMKYFELFMPRMQMCRRAANLLRNPFPAGIPHARKPRPSLRPFPAPILWPTDAAFQLLPAHAEGRSGRR